MFLVLYIVLIYSGLTLAKLISYCYKMSFRPTAVCEISA